MSETQATNEPTTTGDGTPAPGSKEYNSAQIRSQLEAANAELEELRPLKFQKAIRDAGFDPDSDKGKALLVAVEAGKVEAAADQVKDYASSFFGWNPEPALSPTEQTQVDGASRLEGLNQATGSHVPPATDLQAQIAEAEANGDHMRAMALKTQWATQKAMQGA